MFKVIATDIVISKGYDNHPALRYSDKGDSVRFRIGKKIYDPKAENNTRWVNYAVKAFGDVCERIKKMQLKESSNVHIVGRLDEETWSDATTGEEKSQAIIIIEDIEYASGGTRAKENEKTVQEAVTSAEEQKSNPENSTNFTGYEAFAGNSFF